MLRILLPIDFSRRDIHSLKVALQISRLHPLGVTILTCLPDVADRTDATKPLQWSRTAVQNQLGRLRKFLMHYAQLEQMPLEVTVCQELGDPEEAIPRLAQRGQFDLVVMTTSAPGNIWKEITGSTTRDVIDRIEIPVLSIPHNHPLNFTGKIAVLLLINLHRVHYSALHQIIDLTDSFCSTLHCVAFLNHPPEQEEWNRLLYIQNYARETYPSHLLQFAILHGKSLTECLRGYTQTHHIQIIAIHPIHKRNWWIAMPFKPSLQNLYFQTLPMIILPQ